jgi:hypothetical protein
MWLVVNDCILEWMLEVEHCNYQLLIIKDNENKWENEKKWKKIQSMGDTGT